MKIQRTYDRDIQWAKFELAQEAFNAVNWNSRVEMELFLVQRREDIEPLLVRRAENAAKIAAFVKAMWQNVESGEERDLVSSVDATRLAYLDSCEQALHLLLEEHKRDKAMEAMAREALPLLRGYDDAWSAFIQFQRAQLKLDGLDEDRAQVMIERTREVSQAHRELASEVAQHKRTEERLAQLAAIVESSNDAIIGHTLDGRIVSWNSGAERIYGYLASEMVGRPRNILVPPDTADEIPGILERFKQGEKIQQHETVRMRKDGQRIEVSMMLSPVKAVNGDIVGVSAITRDITERKKAEERFYKAFNASPEPITIASVDEGRYLDVNESFLRVTGYRREEVIGRTSLEINFWERPEDRTRLMEAFNKNGSVRDLEITFLTKFGEPRTAVDSAEIVDMAGQKCILAIFKDITEQKVLEKQRKQAEEALAQRAEDLARSNAELEQFAYVASHDLQEPLRMVASYTQLLAKRYGDKLDSDARDFIAFAVDGATRMQALITDLLNYSRVGTRGKSFQSTNCNIILQRVLDALKLAISDSGASVIYDPLPTVLGDDVQLGQLFQNLVANALKFHGEKPPLVHVSAERLGDMSRFSVRDNGIGIAPEHAERIFLIFQRLHPKSEYPGTGIGLAVCKKIVERHGGRIWVDSRPGHGATFFFTIPDRDTTSQEEQKDHER